MPRVRPLSEEEISTLTSRKKPQFQVDEYLPLVADLLPGTWAELELEEGEKSRSIKRRLSIAAKSMGKSLKYRPGPDDRVYFQVSPEGTVGGGSAQDSPRRRGRPRKATS